MKDDQVIADALGLFPSGVYLMTSGFDGQRGGMLVHSVQRCGREPALLCVAARKGHKIDPLIRDSRCFALGVLGEGDLLIERRFRKSDESGGNHPPNGVDPFDAIQVTKLATGAPIIPRCKTWFDCEIVRRVDLEAEMELFVGMVMGVIHNGERVVIDRESDPVSD